MTGLEKGFTGDGEPAPDTGPGPFFPRPTARPRTAPSVPGAPLPAPTAAPAQPATAVQPAVPVQPGDYARPGGTPQPGGTGSAANVLPMTLQGSSGDLTAPVEGRVTVGDEVIGKIAGLAAREVGGIAALVEHPGAAGVRVVVAGEEVTLDVAVAVEYGSVIQDVAKVVQANVARVTGLMVGLRVVAVNVSVEDVNVASDHTAGRA